VSLRELVVLGTASQVPTRHRNHNGYLLLWDGHGILFDPGEGTQRQMLLAGVSASQITRICITHFHGDHSLGLAGIVQRISLDLVPHDVPVHFPASGAVYFERLRGATIYRDHAHITPRPMAVPGIQDHGPPRLTALPLEHTVESWGYRFEEPARTTLDPERLAEAGVRGPAIGRLQRDGHVMVGARRVSIEEMGTPVPGASFAFVMDTRLCPSAVELARGVDLLVAESTYLESEREEARERGHMTAGDAGRLAREAGARQLLLTHFSQRHPTTAPFLAEAAVEFPRVAVASDLARVPVPRFARSQPAPHASSGA
jgi:ribonuclease Z